MTLMIIPKSLTALNTPELARSLFAMLDSPVILVLIALVVVRHAGLALSFWGFDLRIGGRHRK